MGRSRKDCGCGSNNSRNHCGNDSSNDSVNENTDNLNSGSRSRNFGRGRNFFPTDIRKLLILIAEEDDEDNRVDIVLDACANHCFIEDARPIAVMDNTVVLRDGDDFRFVDICCICEVIVDCETILSELFEQRSINR